MNVSNQVNINDDNIIEYKVEHDSNMNNKNCLNLYKESSNIKDKILKFKEQNKMTKISMYEKILLRNEFKKPELKEIVIGEEDYLNFLEELIQRDYFPDIYNSKNVNIILNV